MLKARLLYGGILLSVFVGVETYDMTQDSRIGTSILIAMFSLVALAEFYDMAHRGGRPVAPAFGLVAAVAYFALDVAGFASPSLGVAIVTALMVALPLASRDTTTGERLERLLLTVFGLAYVTLPTSFFLRLVGDPGPPDGLRLFFWIVLVVKASDTGAYFVGKGMGRTPLSSLSPKKTWEGAVGGVLTSVALGTGLGIWILDLEGHQLPTYAAIAAVAAVVGQAGDLLESAIKRGFGVKDSGRFLPGVGGILDSIDSLIPVAPIFVLLYAWLT